MEPILSLVTGTLNRRDSFNRLVVSIIERTPIPWELIVSDASDEPYPDKYPSNVIIIPERPRLGCVKGYNRAFARARGKWVIWLNDDAEVMPGYAQASIEYMEAHPEIGLGALYYCENSLPYLINEYKEMIYPNFGIISKEFGDKISWMDEILTMYGNDNSIAFRTLLAGKGIGSIPGARIWHHVILDRWKMENQQNRSPDARALCDKYMPFLGQMKHVYDLTKHLVGPMRLEID